MEIKHKIRFYLHQSKGKHYIYIQILYMGERLRLATTETIDNPVYWDDDNQRVKISYQHQRGGRTAIQINRALDNYYTATDNVFAKISLIRKTSPTAAQIKQDLLQALGKQYKNKKEKAKNKEEITVEQATLDFIDGEKTIRSWTETIIKQYKNLNKHIQGWHKDINLSMLNISSLADFVQWLTNTRGGNLKNSTAKKRITQLKDFLRWCDRTKYWRNDLYDTFQPKFKNIVGDKQIIFLTKEELQQWMSYQFPKKYQGLERVRDVFTFCCFTGLRHSDVKKLKHEDISDNTIHIVTQKTSDTITINLNDYARQILDKYQDYDDTYALPVIAMQPMNDALKIIAKMVGIDAPVHYAYYQGNNKYEETKPKYEVISTHAARRTFVVTAMTLGIDTNVIMSYTGHSSIAAMKPYMAVVDDLKKQEMDKFNKLFL